MPRDDETDAEEQAKLAAKYYKTLLGEGLSFTAAQRLTVAWILARARTGPERWDGVEDEPA